MLNAEAFQRFSIRLLLGFFVVIMLSALGTGLPAYWLTRRELERQAWNNVANAQQATRSLLQAEQARLQNLALLFSERPTLHQLIVDEAEADLRAYLADFQTQSQLDLLLFCASNGEVFASSLAIDIECPHAGAPTFIDWQDQPLLLVQQPVRDDRTTAILGMANLAIALDDEFWQTFAANTGVQLSLVTADQARIASSIMAADPLRPRTTNTASTLATGRDRQHITLAGQQFYAIHGGMTGVPTVDAPLPWTLEVALPVDQLLAAEQRAFLIFVATTALIAGLGVLLAAWYVRRLTQPLSQLTRAAERIGKGDFVASIPAFADPLEVATLSSALIKSQATMLRALQERTDFLDTVSHEFQTPLSTLQAALELVGDEAENLNTTEMREVLKPAHMSLIGLKNLIDNLLQSSSIEAGLLSMRPRPVHLADVLADARRLVQPMCDRRKQRLQLPATIDHPPLVADPVRLTQVLLNLLVNASKYSPIGEQIDVTVTVQHNNLHIAIADRGPGIPPAERFNLFRRFVRVASTANEQPGVGLGLHVVKTIVEAHGGAVGVDARTGGGTIFWFTVPFNDNV